MLKKDERNIGTRMELHQNETIKSTIWREKCRKVHASTGKGFTSCLQKEINCWTVCQMKIWMTPIPRIFTTWFGVSVPGKVVSHGHLRHHQCHSRGKQRKKESILNLIWINLQFEGVDNMPTENKKCISMWLDNDLVDRIDRHKIDRRFPTRKYLIDSVLRTYMNHVEIEEGSV